MVLGCFFANYQNALAMCAEVAGVKVRLVRIREKRLADEGRSAMVSVFYEDFKTVRRSQNIWTSEEQKSVRDIVQRGSDKKKVLQGSLKDIEEQLGRELADPLKNKIKEAIREIGLSSDTNLKIQAVAIHLEGARTFRNFHRHGGGSLTLGFSEEGAITEVEGLPLPENDGSMFVFMTDGVLHRPGRSEKRLMVFVDFTAESGNNNLETFTFD